MLYDSVMEDYETHYDFVAKTVNDLILLNSKVLREHKTLKAIALRTMVNTQMKEINNIMYELPDWGRKRRFELWGETSRVAMQRDIRNNHTRFMRDMKKIAAKVQQLHTHLDLWYVQEGQPLRDGNIWRAFDESCSKIPSMFPALSRNGTALRCRQLARPTADCRIRTRTRNSSDSKRRKLAGSPRRACSQSPRPRPYV